MRFIGIADIDRSILFYRDILGFEVRDHRPTTYTAFAISRCVAFTRNPACARRLRMASAIITER
jgi:catechol 2,3-dioxygenase-like lactoylglutathione lyase family enzyme